MNRSVIQLVNHFLFFSFSLSESVKISVNQCLRKYLNTQNKPNFQKSAKCPNSFSYCWLLKAGGWPLSKKQTQTKPISKPADG
jgi:hypothetical protein